MVTTSQPTVVVYGATSFTAQQLLEYLDTHPDKESFDLILAGRNRGRLSKAEEKLEGGYEILECDLGDEEGVRAMVERASVVLNFAGPYRWHNAEAIIRQCSLQGKHYLDLSAESHWLSTTIIPKYDYLASKTGACIVPSCGFDSIPSDITLYHALRHLQSVHGARAGFLKSSSFFSIPGASISGGTIQTMYSEAEISDRQTSEYSLVDDSGPRSPFKFIYTLYNPSLPRQLIGGLFVMYPYNRCVIRRSQYLSRMSRSTISRSANVYQDDEGVDDEPRHGIEMIYEEALQTRSRLKALWVSGVLVAFAGLFFGSKIIRRLFSYFLPKAGEGAPRAQLEKSSVKVTNISVSDTTPPVAVLTTYKGVGDPGYLNTAYVMAEAGLSLVLPPPKGFSLPPLAKTGGLLTPSTAMGMVLVERLRISGKATVSSEILAPDGEGKKNV